MLSRVERLREEAASMSLTLTVLPLLDACCHMHLGGLNGGLLSLLSALTGSAAA